MTEAPRLEPRRVLLGLGEADQPHLAIEAATRLASHLATPVECLLVAQQDIISAAGLPFVRAVGPGGMTMPLTSDLLEARFRRLARLVEQELLACCRGARLAWRLEQRRGALRAGLADALGKGDLVVVGPRDLRMAGSRAADLLDELLVKASAVVVPGRKMLNDRPRRLLTGYGDLPELARLLAAALGIEAAGSPLQTAALVVARLDDLQREGEARFLGFLERSGAGAIFLPPSREPRQGS